MPLEVNSTRFEFSHGRAPRGRGSWGFTFDRPTYDDVGDVFWQHCALYADAKRAAQAEGRRRGAVVVYVQP